MKVPKIGDVSGDPEEMGTMISKKPYNSFLNECKYFVYRYV